jgi:hypothetical protein
VPGTSDELPREVVRETVAGLLVRQPSPPPEPPAVPEQPRRVLRERLAVVLDREPIPAEGKSPGTPRHAPR